MSGAPGIEPPGPVESWLERRLPRGPVGRSMLGDLREELNRHVREGGRWPGLWYGWRALRLAWSYRKPRREEEMGLGAGLGREIVTAARGVVRRPGTTVSAVLALALGIGLSTFVFSVVYGARGRGPAREDPMRVLMIRATDARQTDRGLTGEEFRALASEDLGLESLEAYRTTRAVIRSDEGAARVDVGELTPGVLSMLGEEAVVGRGFTPGDAAPDAPPVVLASHRLWQDRLGGSTAAIGRPIVLDGRPVTVVGVMRRGFHFPFSQDLWRPLDPTREMLDAGEHVIAVGRVDSHLERAAVDARVAALGARIASGETPRETSAGTGEGYALRTLTFAEWVNPPQNIMLLGAMLAGAVFVLLVGCANVANLLLARATERWRESGVRAALGAGRARVALPYALEAGLVALGGAALGAAGGAWGIARFEEISWSLGKPYWMHFRLDGPTLIFAAGLGALTALLVGIVPAIRVARTDLRAALVSGGRAGGSRGSRRLVRVLVAGQVALSCALLVGAGLMVRSVTNLADADFPFARAEVLSARLTLRTEAYPDRDARQRLYDAIRERVGSDPSVTAVALASALPTTPDARSEVGTDRAGEHPTSWRASAQPGYFDLVGVGVSVGRDFRRSDRTDAPPVAIVNRSLAERLFGSTDPVGRRIFDGGDGEEGTWRTVVGVVPETKMEGFLGGLDGGGFFVPLAQADPDGVALLVEARSGEGRSLTSGVRRAVREVDPDAALSELMTLDGLVRQNTGFFRVFGSIFTIFGAVALFLTAVGLHGVLAFAVRKRRRELGIRVAVGAGSRQIARTVVGGSAAELAIGTGVGLALAALAGRALALILYDVDTLDPWVYGGTLSVLAVVATLAMLPSILRATRVDPVRELTAEG